MTVFETVKTTHIQNGKLNTAGSTDGQSVVSCFGLPGQNLPAAYCRVDIYVDIAVTSGEKIYARLRNGEIRQNTIVSGSYPSYLSIKKSHFEATPSFQETGIIARNDNIIVSDGVFLWTLPQLSSIPTDTDITPSDYGLKSLGLTLDDIEYDEDSMKGYMYVGGSAVYQVTDPIYPQAQRIEIVGFSDLLDYYPWSTIRIDENSDNKFLSCNRDGGYLQRRKASEWSKVKNKNVSSLDDQLAFRMTAKKEWAKALKTGLGKDEN